MTKEHILREIRRTAAVNDGVPLGRLIFFKETGIREADWKGKFWARWNDAVREAGLEPNQLRQPLEEESLIGNFIPILRRLGRFPVVAEMRLQKRENPNFPNEKTLRDRFGSRKQLAAKILAYCEAHDGFEDVVAICSTALGESAPDTGTEEAPQADGDIGCVYLIKSGRFYKVGRSNSAGRREYELAIQLPEKATTIHTIRTDDPVGIEEYWHKRFAGKRKNGEWFALDPSDVAAFRRRKVM